MKHLFITLILCAAFVSQSFAAVWYVKTTGNDANAGNTWGTAFQSIQKALDASTTGDEIWVAAGTYLPTVKYNGATDRHKTFFIEKDVQLYGGFTGTETALYERDWITNYTALSGDIGLANHLVDNVYHVVWIEARSSAMVLDGFTITKGFAHENDVIHGRGNGIYNNGDHQVSNPTINHCKIIDNEGGDYAFGIGMYNNGNYGEASPILTDCSISYNTCYTNAAGMFNSGYRGIASPKLTDCEFTGNKSYGGANGGGMYNTAHGMEGHASPELTNCTFKNNTALYRGGAMFNKVENDGTCMPILTNCTFSDNEAIQFAGGAIYHGGQTLTLNNCVFTNNKAATAGGIIVLSGNVVATDCTFTGNASTNGDAAAVTVYKSYNSDISSDFTRCTFVSNSASNNGGAVLISTDNNSTSNINFNQCSFSGNRAKNGGGICIDGHSNSTLTLIVNNSLFFNNSATERGGAFCTNQNPSYGSRKIDYCTFYNNTATLAGGAIGTGNDFSGALSPSMRSCIAWGNSSTFGRSATGQGGLSIQNSLIQESACPAGASCSLVIYNKNPLFADPAAYDFHLQGCSAGLDGGLGAIPIDFDGTPRPQGAGCDMGAFEYAGPPTVFQPFCKNITLNLNASGSASITAPELNDGSTGCGPLDFKINDQNTLSYNCSQIGAHSISFKATDVFNNSAVCAATISVRDAMAPTMLCKPVSLTLNAAGQATLTVPQVDNGSYDNCALITKVLSQTTFSCDNVGINSVVLGGVDASSNKGTCTATVTVIDPITPVAKCKNITAKLAADGTVTVVPNNVDNGSTDNCSLNLSLTPYFFNCENVGVNNVTLRATDGSGNFSTCLATVTVQDITAPNALCKNASVFLNDLGQGTLIVSQLNNGSSDACGIAIMTLSKTLFNCSDIPGSSQSVTLTLRDVNNNQSSCTAQVTTKDNLSPTAICQNTTVHLGANGQVTVYPADLAANSFDNCSVNSYSPAAKVYTTANLGNNSLSITVKDWSGNGATCVSVVTVQPFTGLRGGGDRNEAQAAVSTEVFGFHVYPNPTAGDATVDFELTEDQSVALRVFDLTGKNVLTQNLEGKEGANQVRLEMAAMPNGVYVVEIQAGEVRKQKRLVLQAD